MQELIAVVQYLIQGGMFYQRYRVSCDMVEQTLELPEELCGESSLPVWDINMRELRRDRVGFVSQEPLLMEGTIYDNLFYGREEEPHLCI